MSARALIRPLLAAAFLLCFSPAVTAAQYAVSRHVLGSGAATTGGTQLRTAVTVGQPAVGNAVSTGFRVGTGFWGDPSRIPAGSVGAEMPDVQLPERYELTQNYPNPFNPTTRIHYALPEVAHVRLVVYNVLGQQVAVLVNGEQPAGRYEVEWDGRDGSGRPAASGLYLYRLETSAFARARVMTLVK